MDTRNVKLVRQLFKALEEGVEPEGLGEFYGPDVVQIEFPNRLAPRGASRNFEQVKEALARGRGTLRVQRYDILRIFEDGSTVVAEVRWSGELAQPPPGMAPALAASFAVFFEITQGKITGQRNYDCFDPP